VSVPNVTVPSEKAQAAPLHGRIAGAFAAGLHAAFYASMGFMVLAAGLSALRVRSQHA
jgi:hypothetical protein